MKIPAKLLQAIFLASTFGVGAAYGSQSTLPETGSESADRHPEPSDSLATEPARPVASPELPLPIEWLLYGFHHDPCPTCGMG